MSVGIEPVGRNEATLWGLTPAERLARLAREQGLAQRDTDDVILVNLDFVFDPAWLMNPAKVFPLDGSVAA